MKFFGCLSASPHRSVILFMPQTQTVPVTIDVNVLEILEIPTTVDEQGSFLSCIAKKIRRMCFFSSENILDWKWRYCCSRILTFWEGVENPSQMSLHRVFFSWNLIPFQFLFVRYMHRCKMWWWWVYGIPIRLSVCHTVWHKNEQNLQFWGCPVISSWRSFNFIYCKL